MKPKKNPKADITKDISLYLYLGLLLVTFLSWVALEWKTYEDDGSFSYTKDVEEGLDEEVPITQILTPPPPPPPPPPPKPIEFEIVEDDKDIEEPPIESQDLDLDEELNIDDVETVEDTGPIDVPFAIIEDIPLFPGCEKKKTKQAKRKCFQDKINKHVRKHFSYPEMAQEAGIQGRVNVIFTINTDGSIINIKSRGGDESLQKEARRIISKLPKMIPGRQRGKAVRVPYVIPITFRLQ